MKQFVLCDGVDNNGDYFKKITVTIDNGKLDIFTDFEDETFNFDQSLVIQNEALDKLCGIWGIKNEEDAIADYLTANYTEDNAEIQIRTLCEQNAVSFECLFKNK